MCCVFFFFIFNGHPSLKITASTFNLFWCYILTCWDLYRLHCIVWLPVLSLCYSGMHIACFIWVCRGIVLAKLSAPTSPLNPPVKPNSPSDSYQQTPRIVALSLSTASTVPPKRIWNLPRNACKAVQREPQADSPITEKWKKHNILTVFNFITYHTLKWNYYSCWTDLVHLWYL